MDKLNAAIIEAYEGYQTALDYVKGWKQEAATRKAYCMTLINAARKSNPELGAIPAKELFSRTAEMYEAAHTTDEDQESEVEQAPAEDQQEDPDEDHEEQAPDDEKPEPNA